MQAANISHVGDAAEVGALASHFVDVDLQDNLFSSWEEVG